MVFTKPRSARLARLVLALVAAVPSIASLRGIAAAQAAPSLRHAPFESAAEVQTYRETLRKLRNSSLSVDFKDAAIADVARDLSRRLLVNVVVAKPALALEEASAAVTLAVKDVPALAVLKLIEDVSPFAFEFRNSVVSVTTKEGLKKDTTLALYDIAEILYRPPDFVAPDLHIHPGGKREEAKADEKGEPRDPQEIIDLVRTMVEPSAWEGEGVSIVSSHKLLIVRQTPEVQAQVARFLDQLRRHL